MEDDPFRVILFSDIEDFLFPLPSTSGKSKELLLNALLHFCRLPAIVSKNSDLDQDAFVDGVMLEASTHVSIPVFKLQILCCLGIAYPF